MNDQRGRSHASERSSAATVGHDGDHLPGNAVGVKTALGGTADALAQLRVADHKTGAADAFDHAYRVVNGGFEAVVGRAAEHGVGDFAPGAGQAARAAGTHQTGQAQHPLRGQQRDTLGNHAAHARADDVGCLNLQRIQNAQRVPRHVVQAVRRLDAPAQPKFDARPQQAGAAQRVQMRAQPGIAVVKTHDAVTGVHQPLHQRRRPGDKLHAQPHDEQHHGPGAPRRVKARAAVFDFNVQCVGT